MKHLKGVSMAFFALAQSSGSSLAFIRSFNFFLICCVFYIFILFSNSAANMLGNLGPVSTHGHLIVLGQVHIIIQMIFR